MAKKRDDELFGIIGLGRFGLALTQTLAELGKDILVVDNNEAKIRHAAQFTDNAFTVGTLNQDALQEVGIRNCDTVIVCIGEAVDVSILTTLNVIQMGVKRVLAKAINAEHGMVLEKLGAEVIYPEREMAVRVAKHLAMPNMMEYITLGGNVEISEIRLTERLEGATVVGSNLRGRFGINIVTLAHDGNIITEIQPNLTLHEGDMIVVVGKHESIRKFEEFLGE
ncbi:potassium channel family protein [Bacillota bacterium Meth-B3]|nr:TrkA family potassium uptake protein [Christensenellaceae bacterium]MEA5065713.1 TrkA family potassium uptake protein [Eubacteriales bacterium]